MSEVYRLTIAYNVKGQFATNSLYYQFLDSGYATTQAAANALLTRFDSVNTSMLQGMLPDSTQILSYRARRVSSSGGFEAIQFPISPLFGTRTGALMAAAVGPCIIGFPTNNGPVRTKMFIPGVTVDDCVDGVLQNSFKNAMATILGSIFDDLTLAGGGTPVASTVGWHHGPPAVVTDIFAYRMSDTVATQRRRQRPV